MLDDRAQLLQALPPAEEISPLMRLAWLTGPQDHLDGRSRAEAPAAGADIGPLLAESDARVLPIRLVRLHTVAGPHATFDEPATRSRTGSGTELDVVLCEAAQARRTLPVTEGLILSIPATGGRAPAVALNETTVPQLCGPIELSRPLRHPELLPVIGHTAQSLDITLDLI